MAGSGLSFQSTSFRRRPTRCECKAIGARACPSPATLEQIERAAALAAVEHTDGNKSGAARLLGIGRRKLYALLGEVS